MKGRGLFEYLTGLRLRILNWIDAFWGYDVFIAHRRADAAAYEAVYGPGDSLIVATKRHDAKSTHLVSR